MFRKVTFQVLTFLMFFQPEALVNLHTKSHAESAGILYICRLVILGLVTYNSCIEI